jgi:HSP20 family protein
MFARSFWDEFGDFRRSFDQLFDQFYHSSRRNATGERADWTFTPAVETGWSDDHLNLRVILPGVTEKNLNVRVQGNQLVVSGERPAPENFGNEVYQLISYGKFERNLDLPNGLDLDKLQAHLHDGVLDIRIPVAQAMKPRQIQISTGTAHPPKTIAA